jgi:uncharacterized membrane protein YedE/YeeE
MENFTPFQSLAGGLLIGASAALILWGNGQIAGISGILGGLFHPRRGDAAWRLLFIAGMIAVGAAAYAIWPVAFRVTVERSPAVIVLAGALVGFGTRLGSGCTSGHGVCGMGRLSPRSLAATLVFMATGAGTVFVVHHQLGGAS